MRSECFRCSTLVLATLLIANCAGETAAPPPAAREVSTSAPTPLPTAAPAPQKNVNASYAAGMDWLRSARAFSFNIREGDVQAEGEMRRDTIGAERVQFRVDGVDWRATAGPQGVRWERRTAGAWSAAEAPPFGNRLYQRVTLAFDPQKKEGEAQLVGNDAEANHYRFTNANSGEVHDVWVSLATGHPQRMTIGNSVDLRLVPLSSD